jgi:putative RecB family exonuclease
VSLLASRDVKRIISHGRKAERISTGGAANPTPLPWEGSTFEGSPVIIAAMTIYSYSRINTYFNCPAQFKYRYIEKLRPPVPEGIELFLGSRFHETMEYLYQQLPKKIPTVNELVDLFKKHWESHWKESLQTQKQKGFSETLRITQEGMGVDDYLKKGLYCVENYYHQYHPFDEDETVGIEQKVLFNLDEQGRYKMQGYIDRVARDGDGVLWIHDYKTGSRKLSEEDARNEDQLALYQIGLEQNPKFEPRPKIKLAWHFVAFEKDKVVSERNPKEITWLRKKYVSKIQTIEKAKDFSTNTGPLCSWCEFLSLCPDGQAASENRKKRKEAQAEVKNAQASSLKAVPPVANETVAVKKPVDAESKAKPSVQDKKKRKSASKVPANQLRLFE